MLIEEYPDINYEFRPEGYGPACNVLAEILRNVKGTMRRKLILEYWLEGKLDAIDEEWLLEAVSEETRDRLGKIDPQFMGGEYLPDYLPGEVEIVRLDYDSTTRDVVSLRARFSGGRYRYRVVDEYETEYCPAQKTSRRPLTLRGVIRLMDRTRHGMGSELGLVFGSLLDDDGNPWDPRFGNIISVSSEFYPGLDTHYHRHFARIFDEGYNLITGRVTSR